MVPHDRRLSGDGASWVKAAFTHVSPDRVSRFSNGGYGVYYAGDTLETALREHTFHMARFYAASSNAPGWISQVRQLIGSIDSDLADIRQRDHSDILDPDLATYPSAQTFARRMKDARVKTGLFIRASVTVKVSASPPSTPML